MSAIGIDFGTTNSVVAQYSGGRVDVIKVDEPPLNWHASGYQNVLPSVFAAGDDREPLFGWRAKQAATTAKLEAVKRLFATEDTVTVGDETFFVEEIAALLFSHLRRAATDQGVADLNRAVVTIPANSRGLARYRTKLCAGLAGIEVPALINEPTAAAMAFGLRSTSDQTILVVDWGGGTLDVTLLRCVDGIFMEEASKGIQVLGGIDFDKTIARHLEAAIPESITWSDLDKKNFMLDVERAKIELSSAADGSVALPGAGRHDLNRATMNAWVAPLIRRVAEPIEQCLADKKISRSGFDHLLLVGGTCMMPAVREFISELLDREPSQGVSPMTAIAEGAAIASAILAGEHDSDFFVSTEHALGTVALDRQTKEQRFFPIIGRNHKLPARETELFSAVHDFQDFVEVNVIEGDPDRPLDHEDNVILKEWEVPLDPRPADETGFEVTFEYDVNGILHVSVRDLQSGKVMIRDDVSFISGRDPRQLVGMAQRVESVMDSVTSPGDGQHAPDRPRLPGDVVDLLDKARNKVIPFVPEDEGARLESLALALESAASEGDYAAPKSALSDALGRYSYLYL